MKHWETLGSEYTLNDKWFRLRADRCRTERGTIVEPYYVAEMTDWVHITAFDEQDRILVTRQYRHGTAHVSLEIPCGTMDEGEDPAAAMLRELREETGYVTDELENLGFFYPNPARQNNRAYNFLARTVRKVGEQDLDDCEDIEIDFLPVDEILRLIENGEFCHSIHVACVMTALAKTGHLARR